MEFLLLQDLELSQLMKNTPDARQSWLEIGTSSKVGKVKLESLRELRLTIEKEKLKSE